eukprot:CAMPEP_0170410744 /NCGR_PEP_ID=MMETSP0117_2-20130122/30053_1 /TAXON_ID=400756 /ORGANISM="Durinskia baltica, Strain CSIRO CS-38" /LENGTH=308 /DNA_ID=CAMNT_0010668297 /DNA_START=25 /DNA_END=948 /DNA_ORIENTATION=-
MGQGSPTSSRVSTGTVVRPELLVSELVGDVKEDDYYARSTLLLDNFVMDDPTQGRFDPSDALSIDEAFKLINQGYLNLEHGYVRAADGSWYIACLTDLGHEVNGEMMDWWFRHCDDSERFRWWHPRDHISGSYEPQFYAVMPQERKKGHYIDHIHILEEKIAGVTWTLQIEYERPSKLFDISVFPENNITACIVGRVFSRDPSLGLIAVGHVMHLVREVNGRSELRSRFWVGNIVYPETVENIMFARTVNAIVSTSLFKMWKVPSTTARGIWQHCSEEMHCLREFLPHFYRTMKEKHLQSAQEFHLFN